VAAVSDDALSFDDTVGTVLDQFVGRRVQVFVLLPGNPDAPGLMGARGTLYPMGDLAEARRWWRGIAADEGELDWHVQAWATDMTGNPDKLGFSFRERDPLNNFWLDRARFVSAHWSPEGDAPSVVIDLVSGVSLRITEETPRPGDVDDDEDDE